VFGNVGVVCFALGTIKVSFSKKSTDEKPIAVHTNAVITAIMISSVTFDKIFCEYLGIFLLGGTVCLPSWTAQPTRSRWPRLPGEETARRDIARASHQYCMGPQSCTG
jgi:hypothetical protein